MIKVSKLVSDFIDTLKTNRMRESLKQEILSIPRDKFQNPAPENVDKYWQAIDRLAKLEKGLK